MIKVNFGSKELIKCLECLGFSKSSKIGSSHLKLITPNIKILNKGIRPFIIVILGRKVYDPHTRSSYIRQIKLLGFRDRDIFNCFRK
jgi:hypothetical protein